MEVVCIISFIQKLLIQHELIFVNFFSFENSNAFIYN